MARLLSKEVYMLLKQNGGMNTSVIAQKLRKPKISIIRVLHRLQKAGIVGYKTVNRIKIWYIAKEDPNMLIDSKEAILKLLRERGNMTTGQIAKALGFTLSKTSHALKQLEKYGYVYSVKKGRVRYWSVTPAVSTPWDKLVRDALCELYRGAKGHVVCKLYKRVRKLIERKIKRNMKSVEITIIKDILKSIGIHLTDKPYCINKSVLTNICN